MPAAVSRQVAATLAVRVGRDARAAEVADALIAIWRDIDTLLTPLVGQKGVAALHGRSLYLAARSHPWLSRPSDDVLDALDFSWLHRVTSARTPADALEGAGVLLSAFDSLLASLIGPSLGARLLHSVWATPTSGDAAQDTTT